MRTHSHSKLSHDDGQPEDIIVGSDLVAERLECGRIDVHRKVVWASLWRYQAKPLLGR